MKVGLFLDLRNPPPWRQDPARLYGFTVEMCEEADRLGIASIWTTEHHGFDDGYLPQPLTFAAAVAARTNRARIGTAIVAAPFQHPVHLAEQAAVVDLVSGGRLDLGLGAGYRAAEFELFGVPRSGRVAKLLEQVPALRDLWSSGRVTPHPLQSPLPIWLGFTGPSGARRAGVLGERLLSADPALAKPYLAGLAEGGHPPESAHMSGLMSVCVTDDPERDWPTIARHHAYQWDSYNRLAAAGGAAAVPHAIDPERSRQHGLTGRAHDLLVATPEDAARRITAFIGDAPVDTVCLWASIAGFDEETFARNVTTIGTRLVPLLAAA